MSSLTVSYSCLSIQTNMRWQLLILSHMPMGQWDSFADVHQPDPCQQLRVSQEVRRVVLFLVYIVLHCSLLPTSPGFLSSFIQIAGSFLCSTTFRGQCRFRESGNAGTVKCVDTWKVGENWSHSSFIYQTLKVPLVSHYSLPYVV